MPSPVVQTQSGETNETNVINVFTDTFDSADGPGMINESPATTPNGSGQVPMWGSDVIPEEHHARTLLLCFDGTGDQFDADVSIICGGEIAIT